MKTNTPWSPSLQKLYGPLALVVLLLVGFTVVTKSRAAKVDGKKSEVIKFSHKFHVEELGMQCVECHERATVSMLSSDNLLPNKPNCQSCHADQLEQDCTYCHTSDDVGEYRPLRAPARELMFSHKFHVQDQGMSCEPCHAGVEQKVSSLGKSHLPPMESCTTCHNDLKASLSCETCHTDLSAIRPYTHNRTDFMREHQRFARLADASCSTCHTQESCQDCHIGVGLTRVDLPGRDLMTPRSPRLTAIDRGQSMTLAKVHDANFRFTHGIAAKGKLADCQTCHSQDQSCSSCHAAGGNITQVRFKPEWHTEAGFVLIGVGSGGGKHAQMGRRDIESCASCHDTQGVDPSCIACHIDADGIRGTDPKTHPRGFMLGVYGPWHSDPGANCYFCHVDANARVGGVRGQGFCSYCHK